MRWTWERGGGWSRGRMREQRRGENKESRGEGRMRRSGRNAGKRENRENKGERRR